MSGDFTRLGFLFWEWTPIRQLDPTTLKVWLVLYTRSVIPGLWRGDIADLASQSFLSAEDTLRSLDRLLEHELIEFDRDNRVLRLTQFPDAGEWPKAPSVMLSWWKIFSKKVPVCQVRDAHVATLRWLLEEGARTSDSNSLGRPSPRHEEAWTETFGKISIPSSRRRGVRRFGEADLGTVVQPSLFDRPEHLESHSDQPIMSASVVQPLNGVLDPDLKDINNSSDQGGTSRLVLGEGEGDGAGVLDLLSGEGGSGGGHAGGRPHLVLVPMPTEPPTATMVMKLEQLVTTLRTGLGHPRGFDCAPGDERELDTLLQRLARDGCGDGDLPVLGEWLGAGGIRKTLAQAKDFLSLAWWLAGDNLKRSILTARDWKSEAEEKQRELAAAMKDAGM